METSQNCRQVQNVFRFEWESFAPREKSHGELLLLVHDSQPVENICVVYHDLMRSLSPQMATIRRWFDGNPWRGLRASLWIPGSMKRIKHSECFLKRQGSELIKRYSISHLYGSVQVSPRKVSHSSSNLTVDIIVCRVRKGIDVHEETSFTSAFVI